MNLNEVKLNAEVNIFDVCRIYESVIRFTDELKESYNVLSKDINKFIEVFPDVRKHIDEFTKHIGKFCGGRTCRLPATAKVKQLKSTTHELGLLVDSFIKKVDKFIDFLYDNDFFDKFEEEKADELSSLICSFSLKFATFRSQVRKL